MDSRLRVTTSAVTRPFNRPVINLFGRSKRTRGMAQRTFIAGLHVVARLTARARSVVTRETLNTRDDFTMIERGRRHPDHRAVTGRAIGGGLEMISSLAGNRDTVVTRRAGRTDGAVVHFCADGKSARRMADVALLNSGNMVDMLAARELAVVTTRTLRR